MMAIPDVVERQVVVRLLNASLLESLTCVYPRYGGIAERWCIKTPVCGVREALIS